MLPTFILAGAPKCGTTSLWEYLQVHPDVCTCVMKEPKFFYGGIINIQEPDSPKPNLPGNYNKGLPWYQSLFRQCKTKNVIGEATGNYFSASESPQLIKKHLPDITLLFILRDPVERIYSHYWQEIRSGNKLPNFNTLIQQHNPAFERYAYISKYQIHIQRYYKYFSKEQINIFLFDDLKNNPKKLIHEVYQTINVNPNFLPKNIGKQFNKRRMPYFYWVDKTLFRLSNIYRTTIKQNPPRWLHQFALMMLNSNSKIRKFPPMSKSIRKDLVAKYEETIEFVETTLNRSLPSWRQF